MTVPTDIKSERIFSGTHSAIEDKNALYSHIEIITATTHLWVTSS